jgi:phosphoribosylformylglycinamidine (FGAM) synthase-like enzyme
MQFYLLGSSVVVVGCAVVTSATFNSTWNVVAMTLSVLVDSDDTSESTVVVKNESKIDSVVDRIAEGLVLGIPVVVGRVSVTDSTVVWAASVVVVVVVVVVGLVTVLKRFLLMGRTRLLTIESASMLILSSSDSPEVSLLTDSVVVVVTAEFSVVVVEIGLLRLLVNDGMVTES